MIAAEQAAGFGGQQVADLPVRVVDNSVENGHLAQRRVIGPASERDEIGGGIGVDP